MDQFVQRNRVPSEHLGQARLFRARILQQSDILKERIMEISLPLIRRMQRKGALRRDNETDLIRLWGKMGLPFRYSFGSGRDASNCLWVEEIRLDSIDLKFAEWEDDAWEPGVAVSRLKITTHRQFLFESTPITIVSLHALARYLERSGRRTDDDIFHDLAPLIDHQRPDEHMPTTHGFWLGEAHMVANASGRQFEVRAVRTYISGDRSENNHRAPRRALLPSSRPVHATAVSA
jgi:hypothetical protein